MAASNAVNLSKVLANRTSCHLQGEYLMTGCFGEPYTGQAVSGELDLTVLIASAATSI
jgi:hypothetical protein